MEPHLKVFGHIFMTGEFTSYLPMQKLVKMRPRRSSELISPVISPNAFWARAHLLGEQFTVALP